VDFNLALASQLLGIITTDRQGMLCRALSFDAYEQVEHDIVDWYDDDGFAPVPVAILVMVIHNNQGAMLCLLEVQYQVETDWGRVRRIWNRASHSLGRHFACGKFQQNLEYLVGTNKGTACAT